MSEFCVRLLSCAMSRLWQFEGCCVSMQAWLVRFCAIVWQLATSGALCSLATMYIACNSRSVHYASDSCFWRVICGVLWLVGMPYVRFQLWWPSSCEYSTRLVLIDDVLYHTADVLHDTLMSCTISQNLSRHCTTQNPNTPMLTAVS